MVEVVVAVVVVVVVVEAGVGVGVWVELLPGGGGGEVAARVFEGSGEARGGGFAGVVDGGREVVVEMVVRGTHGA